MRQPLIRRAAIAALCLGVCTPLLAAVQDEQPDEEAPVAMATTAFEWLVEPTVHYPQSARYLGVEAKITALVVVNSSGKPVRTRIVRRDPVHADMFDEEIRTALMKSRLRLPASVEPARHYSYRAPFNFVLHGAGDGAVRLIQSVPAAMPAEALLQGVDGWVSVLVKVDADGRPDMRESRIVGRDSPQFRPFDASALEAVGQYRFSPSRLQDRTETRWTLVRVDFCLPQP